MIKPQLKILFEDNHCLVAFKPAKLLTASDKTGDDTMIELVREYYNTTKTGTGKGYLVPIHFLDRPVSGVMIFAKSSKSASRLNEQFRSHTIKKVYLAIVEGEVKKEKDELRSFIKKDRKKNISTEVDEGIHKAKDSSLIYKRLLVMPNKKQTLLMVFPETGRSHQIRVLLSGINHPIYGDVKYGSHHACDGNIMLHAYSLTFEHPTTKEMLTIKANPPKEWNESFNNIGESIKKILLRDSF